MLKLSPNFYITSIDTKNRWNSSKLEQEYKYNFRYKEFQVELTTMFTIIGHTQKDNIAIINFGYAVGIERWSDKAQRFCYIDETEEEDGRVTKRYLDSQEARELILRFIEKRVDSYLSNISPAIIVRGALSDIKVNLPRYKRLDAQLFKHDYHKKEFDIKQSDSLYKIAAGRKSDDDKVIWVYCKDERHFKKLEDVFK